MKKFHSVQILVFFLNFPLWNSDMLRYGWESCLPSDAGNTCFGLHNIIFQLWCWVLKHYYISFILYQNKIFYWCHTVWVFKFNDSLVFNCFNCFCWNFRFSNSDMLRSGCGSYLSSGAGDTRMAPKSSFKLLNNPRLRISRT